MAIEADSEVILGDTARVCGKEAHGDGVSPGSLESHEEAESVRSAGEVAGSDRAQDLEEAILV